MNPSLTHRPLDLSYAVLAAIWLLVTLPLAWLAAWELEVMTNSLQLAGMGDALPILTRWYQFLGTSGVFLVAMVPSVLGLAMRLLRSSGIVIVALTLVVAASVYFSFLGLLAALLAYTKVSF